MWRKGLFYPARRTVKATRRSEASSLKTLGGAVVRDDIRVECAGVIAGSWFAGIGKRGEDLIAAGLLMLAGYVDLDELDKWVRIGWERRRGASEPYPDDQIS